MSTAPENETPIWERIRDLEATNKDLKTALKIANQHLKYLRGVQVPPETALEPVEPIPVLPLADLVSVLQSEVSVLRNALTDEQNHISTLETALVNTNDAVQREKNRVSELEKENARLRKACAPAVHEPAKPLWEPKGGQWAIGAAGKISNIKLTPIPSAVSFGLYRGTEEQAKGAAKAMRYFNRLLAYRDEVEPDFYACRGGSYYWVYYDTDSEVWDIQHVPATSRQTQVVYFSNRVAAIKLAAQLTAGEVVL